MNSWALFKVVEIDRGIALINATEKSDRPDAIELILADINSCMYYFSYYVYARARGRTQAEAHKQAIAGVSHVRCWQSPE